MPFGHFLYCLFDLVRYTYKRTNKKQMTLPNKLSFARMFLTPFAVIFLFVDIPYNYHIAILIYVIAASTDVLDGYIARKYDMVTSFGKFFDPLVDKILNHSMLITLLALGVFPLWVTLLILLRDIIVDAFSSLAVSHKKYISAKIPGKLKSLFVVLAIILGELSLAANAGYNIFGMSYETLRNGAYLLLIISLLTGFAGSLYLLQGVVASMKENFKMDM